MIRLFVIADDFTGALDTGVQFASYGAPTKVIVESDLSHMTELEDTQVLVIDAEARHLSADDAYHRVFKLVHYAVQTWAPCIYIKTDSALRGNIGAQLAAALNASECNRLHFVPAFPQMQRITKSGVHYIDNTPVAQSIFGNDPFEPVTESYLPKLIAKQTDTPCTLVTQSQHLDNPEGILVYDAASTRDLRMIANHLSHYEETSLLAGCAGFASVLPYLLHLSGSEVEGHVPISQKILVACGSINPVSRRQCTLAEESGAPRFRLTPAQRLTDGWEESREADFLLSNVSDACANFPIVVVDVGEPGSVAPENIKENRLLIAKTFGGFVKRLLDQELPSILFVMGGDTLLSVMQRAGLTTLIPLCEISPGIVMSRFHYRDQERFLLSKSGGFGDDNLFDTLQKTLSRWNHEIGCR